MEVCRRLRLRMAAIMVTLVFTGAVMAQEVTGDIRGIVRDPSGAVVPNAKVEIVNTERGSTLRTITTGQDGSYVASTLPVGRYQVVVQAPGFQKYVANIQDALPLAPQDRPSKRGLRTPMEVMDAPLRAGDLRHGYQAVADNLPNHPRIHERKGSKKIFSSRISWTRASTTSFCLWRNE